MPVGVSYALSNLSPMSCALESKQLLYLLKKNETSRLVSSVTRGAPAVATVARGSEQVIGHEGTQDPDGCLEHADTPVDVEVAVCA
jgi:hypothetical protein